MNFNDHASPVHNPQGTVSICHRPLPVTSFSVSFHFTLEDEAEEPCAYFTWFPSRFSLAIAIACF